MLRKIENFIIFLCATIASLGTYPYAKAFSQTMFTQKQLIAVFSILFVLTAVSCNIILSAQSLTNSLNQVRLKKHIKQLLILIVSLISALANGFICFVGYSHHLPMNINIFFSCIVVLVNTGISFNSISGLISEINVVCLNVYQQVNERKIIQLIVYACLFLCAILASVTVYLASVHVLNTLFINSFFSEHLYLINVCAALIWIPWAALYIIVSQKIFHQFMTKCKKCDKHFHLSKKNILICCIGFFSGSAYAQMAFEFFDHAKNIPNIFKHISNHNFLLFTIIIPITFIMSSILNAYALNEFNKKKLY